MPRLEPRIVETLDEITESPHVDGLLTEGNNYR
jgi:hypothetical protein